MSKIVTFKFLVQENGKPTGDIRRVTMQAPVTLASLRDAACDILSWPSVSFSFKDEDNDVVTIASQHELDTAVTLARGAAVRLNVSQVNVEKEAALAPAPAAAAAPAASAAPAAAAANVLSSAPNATFQDNAMVQFSVIAEFFQRLAQQVSEFAPRIPVLVNEGLQKMSSDVHTTFCPVDATVDALRTAPADATTAPAGEYTRVVHRLPETIEHPGVECAHCHKKPIAGMRYRCVQCDCNLCQDCVRLPDAHTPEHMFLPICAPAVGSRLANSVTEARDNVKARAEPVTRDVRAAVEEAMTNARAKGVELTEKWKQQMAAAKAAVSPETSSENPEDKPAEKPAEKPEEKPAEKPEKLKGKDAEVLQQLHEMGFTDDAQLIPLVEKHHDLNRVVQELVH